MISKKASQALRASIKKSRENNSLTQEQLADKANISTRLLQKYEAGEQRPRYETLFKIAESLNIEPVLFVGEMWQAWKKNKGE